MSTRTITLSFDDALALRDFARQARRDGACLVPVEGEPKPYAPVTVALCWRRLRVEVEGEVVQLFPAPDGGRRAAVELADTGPLDALAEAGRGERRPRHSPARPRDAAAGRSRDAGGLAGEEASEPTREAPPGEQAGETLGVSPVFRIREMQVPERRRLAPRAARSERQVLLRDPSPQVLQALLANPRLEEREVLEMVGSPQASGGLLERIGKDPRWASNYEIRLAVVKNPRTPTPLALRLLAGLNKKDLGVLGKSGQVREAVKGAALRLYLKRL